MSSDSKSGRGMHLLPKRQSYGVCGFNHKLAKRLTIKWPPGSPLSLFPQDQS